MYDRVANDALRLLPRTPGAVRLRGRRRRWSSAGVLGSVRVNGVQSDLATNSGVGELRIYHVTCVGHVRSTWRPDRPPATSGGGEERQKRQLRQISRDICDVITTEFPGNFSGVM